MSLCLSPSTCATMPTMTPSAVITFHPCSICNHETGSVITGAASVTPRSHVLRHRRPSRVLGPGVGQCSGKSPERPGSDGRRMSPDDRLPLRICGRDGLCRRRTESLRDTLGANVVWRDQRDKLADGSTLICPLPDPCGCLGRISVSPVGGSQGPAKLGLSMTSRGAQVEGVQLRVSKIMRPAWPTTCRSVPVVTRMKAPSPSVLQPPIIPSSIMARTSSTTETGSLPNPCMTSASANRSYRASASRGVGARRQSLSV